MLPKYYKVFLEQLFMLQKQVLSESIDIAQTKIIFEQVSRTFEHKIFNEDMHIYFKDNHKHTIIQSVKVEINKHLRLLKTELLFLESARQLETIHKRINKIQQRITKLIDYCKFVNTQFCESKVD